MIAVARTDTSVLGRWWWTVDRWLIAALVALMAVGAVLVITASPPVAERIGVEPYYFVKRHLMLLPVAAALMFGASLLTPRGVLRLSIVLFAVAIVLLVLTLLFGVEVKGARRWLSLGGFSLQPSELVKPTFAVVAAWLFSEQKRVEGFPGSLISLALFLMCVGLIVMQPDLGMTVVLSAVWLAQFFVAGVSIWLVLPLAGMGAGGLVAAYFLFPHVASRVDRFLDPSSGDTYQVNRSLEAFMNGGVLGRGPGTGRVKEIIPDAHADFIFAVAGEELGVLVCLLIVGLFMFVVLRGFSRLLSESNMFVLLAGGGLFTHFGLQALINMGSALNLIPTKGMTLPFISYGDSSMLSAALVMGALLALTRTRAHEPAAHLRAGL